MLGFIGIEQHDRGKNVSRDAILRHHLASVLYETQPTDHRASIEEKVCRCGWLLFTVVRCY